MAEGPCSVNLLNVNGPASGDRRPATGDRRRMGRLHPSSNGKMNTGELTASLAADYGQRRASSIYRRRNCCQCLFKTMREYRGPGQRPSVSVVIPHYNDLGGLGRCYVRLQAQTWPKDDLEIVVADNNSTCGMDAVRSVVPSAIVVPAPVQGAGPARNAGVAASRGRILAFLDSDCVPEPEWIMEGVKALKRYDFVGGQVITFARRPDRPSPTEAYESVFNFNFRRYIEKVGFTGTGNMFVPRLVFDRVGGFRTGVAEDIDWSFRARTLGYQIGYAGRAVVGHPARRNWSELEQRWARMEAEHFLLWRERRYGRVLFALRALVMPVSAVPDVGKVLLTSRLSGPRARLGAIAVLFRLRVWRAWRMLWLVWQDSPCLQPRALRR
jgi:glycosyltransferase involved in cell wall biosynthesis